jgi:riboflavin kinase/FMN adenylyltransferase
MTPRIYASLQEVEEDAPGGRVVAVGVFDGVHVGHQRILNRAANAAATMGGRATAVTFHPHPEAVLRPRSAPRILTLPTRKAELLGSAGIEEVVTLKFDREFAQLSPEAFCQVVLSDRLATRAVMVGENFRFGRDGAGTAAHLNAYGRSHGFAVESVPLVNYAGEPISSTRVRVLLRAGEVAQAAELLGRPHRVEGTVISGAGRGRTLKAPTANLKVVRNMALPRLGVYATRSVVGGVRSYPSVTSVGTNPTFESTRKVRIETLLFDFEGDLYGTQIGIDFLERIRGQKAFSDTRALGERIAQDIEAAREIQRRMGPGSAMD